MSDSNAGGRKGLKTYLLAGTIGVATCFLGYTIYDYIEASTNDRTPAELMGQREHAIKAVSDQIASLNQLKGGGAGAAKSAQAVPAHTTKVASQEAPRLHTESQPLQDEDASGPTLPPVLDERQSDKDADRLPSTAPAATKAVPGAPVTAKAEIASVAPQAKPIPQPLPTRADAFPHKGMTKASNPSGTLSQIQQMMLQVAAMKVQADNMATSWTQGAHDLEARTAQHEARIRDLDARLMEAAGRLELFTVRLASIEARAGNQTRPHAAPIAEHGVGGWSRVSAAQSDTPAGGWRIVGFDGNSAVLLSPTGGKIPVRQGDTIPGLGTVVGLSSPDGRRGLMVKRI